MILYFPYLDEALRGPPPPSLKSTVTHRWRPLLPVAIIGPGGMAFTFGKALVDPGADDTIFPFDVASLLGAPLLPATNHSMRWQGQRFALRYGAVSLELEDDNGSLIRWPTIVGFTSAAIRYPLLGVAGCLEYFDVTFLGAGQQMEIEPNSTFPGAVQP